MIIINSEKNNSLKSVFPILIISFFGLMYIFNQKKFDIIKDSIRPIFISFILAYLLDSFVRLFVVKLKINRFQGILIASIILLFIVSSVFAILVPILIDNAQNIVSFLAQDSMDIGEIVEKLADKVDNEYMDKIAESIIKLSSDIKGRLNELIRDLSSFMIKSLATIGTSAFTIITSVILSLYMLFEKDEILARLKRIVYAYFSKTVANSIMDTCFKANEVFKRFLVGKLTDSLIVGIISIVIFSVFKIPYAPLFGSIIGLFNLIPYFGPIIGAVPVIIVVFIIEPPKAIVVAIIIIVVGQLDANFLDPKIVGGNIGVSPFWVITSVLIGGSLFGIIGMIFSVPLMVVFKSMIEESVEIRLEKKNMSNYEMKNINNDKM